MTMTSVQPLERSTSDVIQETDLYFQRRKQQLRELHRREKEYQEKIAGQAQRREGNLKDLGLPEHEPLTLRRQEKSFESEISVGGYDAPDKCDLPSDILSRNAPASCFPSPFIEALHDESSPIAKDIEKHYTEAEDVLDLMTTSERLSHLREVIQQQRRHISALQHQQNEKEQQLIEETKAKQKALEHGRKQDHMVQTLQDEITKERETSAALRREGDDLKERLHALQDEFSRQKEQLQKAEKDGRASSAKVKELQFQVQQQQKDLRRLQEELRRHRVENAAAAAAAVAAEHQVQARKAAVQRDLLVAAVKKQQQLIEVLQQQKLHLEASRLLQFTEEEFLAAIGERDFTLETQERHQEQLIRLTQQQLRQKQPHLLEEKDASTQGRSELREEEK